MPVKNAAQTVCRAVDSILDQTWPNWELIIIDDGSTDDTAQLISNYVDPRIRIVAAPDKGFVEALNYGISQSGGKYIARMDSDDYSHPSRLGKQLSFLDTHPGVGMVSCLIRYQGNPAESRGYFLHVEWMNSLTSHQEIYNQRFVESPFAHPSIMIRKSILQFVSGYAEGPFPEDYDLWLRILDRGIVTAKIPECLFDWYDSADRLSRVDQRYSGQAFFRTKARYFSKWFFRHYPDLEREVWVWGHGKAVREKSKWLKECGIGVKGYIDVKQPNPGPYPVVFYQDLPQERHPFVVSYVGDRLGKRLIKEYLEDRSFMPGVDYYLMA